jgi:hypothetical protein
LVLPSVTLVTVTGVNIESAHVALLRCADHGRFGAIKMLSPTRPLRGDERVTYVDIPPIDLAGYNRFIIAQLAAHVDTEHCLIVQADGFILNPGQWDDRFLDYDYIGAPWPERLWSATGELQLVNRVGNGGFSLRSRRLLHATSRLDCEIANLPEDVVICHYLHEPLTAAGIRFAPLELAARFSIETGIPGQSLRSTLGFHGKHLLPLVPWTGQATR